MLIDFSNLSSRDAYNWMINTITPRPIAWVSTISAAGQTNLAPFSYFQAVCSKPPTLMFSGAVNRHGISKDSVINIREVPEFVVNLVPFALAEQMNLTATPLPRGESEFEKFGIAAAAAQHVRPPRVADAPVAFECKLDRILDFGEGPGSSNVVFGTVLCAHLSDAILTPEGAIDPAKLDTIGRMGGDHYVRTRELFTVVRPR